MTLKDDNKGISNQISIVQLQLLYCRGAHEKRVEVPFCFFNCLFEIKR